MDNKAITDRIAAVLRIGLGWIFFWAFLDKLFGLGYATPAARSWINGGSPTMGFLSGVEGPFAGLFNAMAGNVVVDSLFMIGLLGIGVALLLGIGMHIACFAGATMLVLMWLAVLPLDNNPFLDDHILYAIALILLLHLRAGHTWGLGDWWSQQPMVQRTRWLE